jgi:hypothetical protein
VFGTHRTLFYYRRQELFVVSLAVLLGSLILRRRVHTRPWVLGLFAPPLLLVVRRRAVLVNESRGVVRVVEQVLVTATLVVLPIVIWVIARLVAPDYFSLPDWRLKLAVLAVAATVGVIGLLFGRFNDRFLTCEVIVAGDKPPPNCVHVRR